MLLISNKGYWREYQSSSIIAFHINANWEERMNKWLILLCCIVFISASLMTTGLTRALIDLAAFSALLWLVFRSQNPTQD